MIYYGKALAIAQNEEFFTLLFCYIWMKEEHKPQFM